MNDNSLRCLKCYDLLEGNRDYHPKCSAEFFGTEKPPVLDLNQKLLEKLATEMINSKMAVTGVQKKLSLKLNIDNDQQQPRLTIVGFAGDYILKPATDTFPHLPENEDLTMRLAQLCGIKTVPHTLIRLKTGKIAYLTKRIDRNNGRKVHMEDMCQITERLTEHKYKGSHEQVAKAILKHSHKTLFDISKYYELVLFSFVTGNSDMHLKNFSMIATTEHLWQLSPAYDLLSTHIAMPEDEEELALTLNGKKKKMNRKDFTTAMTGAGLTAKATENLMDRITHRVVVHLDLIKSSFLPSEKQSEYIELVQKRLDRLKD